MSAEAVVQAALAAALETLELNGVYASAPARARAPYAVLAPVLGGDWGAKDRAGRELRIGATLHDEGPSPARLQALLGEAGVAIEAMPRDLDGWRVASCVLVRSRLAGAGPDRWSGSVDYRVRVLATG